MMGMPPDRFELSRTLPLSGGALNGLDLIDHKEFDAALLNRQHEFHEQHFFVVARHLGSPAFQQHPPQQGSGAILADGSFNTDDGDAGAHLFTHWQVSEQEPVQIGRLAHP